MFVGFYMNLYMYGPLSVTLSVVLIQRDSEALYTIMYMYIRIQRLFVEFGQLCSLAVMTMTSREEGLEVIAGEHSYLLNHAEGGISSVSYKSNQKIHRISTSILNWSGCFR